MPLAWQRFRDKVRETDLKGSIFAPGDGAVNIYSNPYAGAYNTPAPAKRPVKPKVRQPSTTPVVVDIMVKGDLECTVCLENKPCTDFRVGKITAQCEHEMDVCKVCLLESIDYQFDANIWDHIDCPSCGSRLAAEDVNKYGSKAVRNKYVMVLFHDWSKLTRFRYNEHCLKAMLESEQHYQQCRHPGCEYGAQISNIEAVSWLACPSCQGKTCISCDTIWHTGLSCEEEQERLAQIKKNDEASEERIKKEAKRCPKCDVPGEKISGCDHMKCPSCQYEYCWICFADYDVVRKKSNSAHEKDCKYHTSRLH